MLMLQAEEDEALKVKSLKTLSFEGCYDKDWVAALNKQSKLKSLQCLLCNKIANNGMELTCNEHEGCKDPLLVGEQCLMKYLHENNNTCPIKKHGPCSYMKGRALRNIINELKVMCPRQFINYCNQKANDRTKEGDTNTETEHVCKFKGKIEEMKEHLEKTCPLKTLKCKFKEFGCDDILFDFNFEQHLQLQMKKHLDLLLDYISVLRNKIKRSQFNETEMKLKFEEQGYKIQLLMSHIEAYKVNESNQLKLKIDEYEQSIKLLKDKNLQLTQDFQTLSEKPSNQDKGEKEEQKQSKNRDDSSSLMSSGTVHTLNLDSFRSSSKLLKTFIGHNNVVWSIDYSTFGDEQFICSGSKDKTVCVWDVETNKLIQLPNGHSEYVHCAKFSQYHYHKDNQNVICSSSNDKIIRFWDFKHNKQLQIFNEHTVVADICVLGHMTKQF
ncbi:hypothetical protein RFI_18353, partial [Reticulomyxa filosa]